MSNPESQQSPGETAEVLMARLKLAVLNNAKSPEEYDEIMSRIDSGSDKLVEGVLEKNRQAEGTTEAQQAPGSPVVVEVDPVPEPNPARPAPGKQESQINAERASPWQGEAYSVKPGETKLFPLTLDEIPYVHVDPDTNRPPHFMAGVRAVLQAEVPVQFGLDGSVLATARTDEGVVFTDIDGMRHPHRRVVLEHFLKRDFKKQLERKGITDPDVVNRLLKKNIEEGKAFVALKKASAVTMISPPFAPDDGVKTTIPSSAAWMHVGLGGVEADAVDVYLHKDQDEEGRLKLRLDTVPPTEPNIMSHIMRIGMYGGNMAVHNMGFTALQEAMHMPNESGPQIIVSSLSRPVNPEDIGDKSLESFIERLASRDIRLPSQVVPEPEMQPAQETEKPKGRNPRQRQSPAREATVKAGKSAPETLSNGHQDPASAFSVLKGVSSSLITSTAPDSLSSREARRIRGQVKTREALRTDF